MILNIVIWYCTTLNGTERLQNDVSISKVDDFISKYHLSDAYPIPDEIRLAVKSVWDGNKESALVIADVVRSLKPLMREKDRNV